MIVEEFELECISFRNILLLLVIMRWLLVGCCGLALVNFSVALNQTVTQAPRFYGVRTGRDLFIYCVSSKRNPLGQVKWYKASQYNTVAEKRSQLSDGERISIWSSNTTISFLSLLNLNIEDSGVYYCMINNILGPGTELQVVKPINLDKAVYRNKVKDGLIIFQVVLLAICIVAPLLRNHTLSKKDESIYDEPEQDHIYEGLTIETCGGLYEEISLCGQAGQAEAPWKQDY